MAIQPTQPQGIGGVLDTTFQLYKSSLGVLWPLCLLLSIVGSPPNIYLLVKGNALTAAAGVEDLLAVFTDPIYLLVVFVTWAGMMWVTGALYLKQNAVGTDVELSNGAALQAAVGRILPLFVMGILFAIAVGLGTLLLLIPGLILFVSLVLGTALVVLERKGPIAALTGSHKLVWGNWWRTLIILSIGGILVIVIYMAVALVIGVITPFIGLGMDDLVLYSTVSTLLITVLMNVLVTPFFSALLIAQYWDLKLRKEGGDLAARVGALNAA
jgi:hypothetical protein